MEKEPLLNASSESQNTDPNPFSALFGNQANSNTTSTTQATTPASGHK